MEPSKPVVQIVEIDEESAGQRVDNYLVRILKGVPRSHVYKLMRRGEVRLNGRRVRANSRLQPGDRLRLPPVRTSSTQDRGDVPGWLAKKLNNSIIYKDNRMFVLNKPAGVAVHGGSGVSAGVIEAMRKLHPDEKSLELVHRLDRETSGCLMIARRRSGLRQLQQALRDKRQLHKYYLVVVHGRWPSAAREVTMPLSKNLLQSGERISRVSADGKPSLTRFRILATSDDYSLLEAEPVTGRTHQIRVHCACSGYPVVGDPKYGRADLDKPLRKLGYNRMMLHASRLVLPPTSEGAAPIMVEARPDDQFVKFKKFIKNNKL